MKKKIIIIILACLIAILIGVLTYKFTSKEKTENIEEVKIPNVSFSLNDVLNKFLNTKYASNNKCKGSIKDKSIILNCQNKEYIYKLDNIELTSTTSKEGLDVFKNLVVVIENLNGYKDNEYEETINKVINNEIYISGIKYQKKDNNYNLSILVNKKLDKYENKEIISKEEIKSIEDTNYEYKKDSYLVSNINLAKDEEDQIYVISAYFSGNDFNKVIKIKYYDNDKNIIKEDEVKLNEYNNYGNDYLIFTKTTNLNELFNQVKYYSINIE